MTERVTIIEAKDRFRKGGEGADKETKAPAFSEDAIALKFTELHGDDLRYVAPWGKWLIWNGECWAFDSTVADWSERHLRRRDTGFPAAIQAKIGAMNRNDLASGALHPCDHRRQG